MSAFNPLELIQTLPESFLSAAGHVNQKLMLLLTEEAETLRRVFEAMRSLKTADECTGRLLDSLGELLQGKRMGRSDDSFKEYLRLLPKARSSAGSVPDLIDIARLVAGEYFVLLRELYPGNIGSDTWLDGSWYLAGEQPDFLSGDEMVPATIEIRIRENTPDDVTAALENAISLANAAGCGYRIVKTGK